MWAWWVYSAWNKEAFVLYALGNFKHNAPILLCHETFSQHSPWFMITEPTIRPEEFKHDIRNRGCIDVYEPCSVLLLSPALWRCKVKFRRCCYNPSFFTAVFSLSLFCGRKWDLEDTLFSLSFSAFLREEFYKTFLQMSPSSHMMPQHWLKHSSTASQDMSQPWSYSQLHADKE